MTEKEILRELYRGEPDSESILAAMSPAERAMAVALASPKTFGKDRAEKDRVIVKAIVKRLADKWRYPKGGG